ncbi:hypothetical protein C0Q70_02614 [Pomacea canaliculata]|uniref:Uncharacterized protein n=1 Tax=Pomacea canaliculata TaxID=400727 RepID=A0A2T7PQE6_POMCA|nr:hypothetical protein C0Q70_02614 [Pomacea canaliculata]
MTYGRDFSRKLKGQGKDGRTARSLGASGGSHVENEDIPPLGNCVEGNSFRFKKSFDGPRPPTTGKVASPPPGSTRNVSSKARRRKNRKRCTSSEKSLLADQPAAATGPIRLIKGRKNYKVSYFYPRQSGLGHSKVMKEFSAKRFMCGRLCNTAITEHHPAATVELSSHTRGRESETGWRHLQVLVGGGPFCTEISLACSFLRHLACLACNEGKTGPSFKNQRRKNLHRKESARGHALFYV